MCVGIGVCVCVCVSACVRATYDPGDSPPPLPPDADEDDQKELLCNKLTSCKDCISGPSDNPNATVSLCEQTSC